MLSDMLLIAFSSSHLSSPLDQMLIVPLFLFFFCNHHFSPFDICISGEVHVSNHQLSSWVMTRFAFFLVSLMYSILELHSICGRRNGPLIPMDSGR